MEQLSSIQSALYHIVKRFVQRQALVLEALRDLRPDLVMEETNIGSAQERAEIREKFIHNPAMGYWGKNSEWEYFLHGTGCRLVNVETKENLQWDIGDLQRFDRFWFINYLHWLLNLDMRDADTSFIKCWLDERLEPSERMVLSNKSLESTIFPVLEQLNELGVLTRNEQYFTLVAEQGKV